MSKSTYETELSAIQRHHTPSLMNEQQPQIQEQKTINHILQVFMQNLSSQEPNEKELGPLISNSVSLHLLPTHKIYHGKQHVLHHLLNISTSLRTCLIEEKIKSSFEIQQGINQTKSISFVYVSQLPWLFESCPIPNGSRATFDMKTTLYIDIDMNISLIEMEWDCDNVLTQLGYCSESPTLDFFTMLSKNARLVGSVVKKHVASLSETWSNGDGFWDASIRKVHFRKSKTLKFSLSVSFFLILIFIFSSTRSSTLSVGNDAPGLKAGKDVHPLVKPRQFKNVDLGDLEGSVLAQDHASPPQGRKRKGKGIAFNVPSDKKTKDTTENTRDYLNKKKVLDGTEMINALNASPSKPGPTFSNSGDETDKIKPIVEEFTEADYSPFNSTPSNNIFRGFDEDEEMIKQHHSNKLEKEQLVNQKIKKGNGKGDVGKKGSLPETYIPYDEGTLYDNSLAGSKTLIHENEKEKKKPNVDMSIPETNAFKTPTHSVPSASEALADLDTLLKDQKEEILSGKHAPKSNMAPKSKQEIAAVSDISGAKKYRQDRSSQYVKETSGIEQKVTDALDLSKKEPVSLDSLNASEGMTKNGSKPGNEMRESKGTGKDESKFGKEMSGSRETTKDEYNPGKEMSGSKGTGKDESKPVKEMSESKETGKDESKPVKEMSESKETGKDESKPGKEMSGSKETTKYDSTPEQKPINEHKPLLTSEDNDPDLYPTGT